MDNAENSKSKSAASGYFMAVLQAVMYSTMGIFGKFLYATGLDAQQVVILRFASATVILGVFLAIWRKQSLISRQPAVYLQAVFFFTSAIFYFLTVEHLTAGMTTVIFYLYPAIVAAGSSLVFKEKFTLSTFVALVMAFAGLLFVSGIFSGDAVLDPLGVLYGFLSCLAFAVYTLLIQKTSRTEGPLTSTFTLSFVSLIASCIFFAPSVPELLTLSAYQWALAAAMALVCTVIPIVIYIEAVKRIGATKTSLIGISETPSSLLFAFLLLGEVLTVQQGIGSVLIVLSIVVVTVAPLLGAKSAKKG